MSLIVEDGTGLVEADSYVSVEYADDYFAARGIVNWGALTTADKEFALINATDYIDQRFSCFKGELLNPQQGLMFPRTLWEGIPANLKRACCEYALISTERPLWFIPEVDDSGFAVQERKEKVGPIEESVKYAVGEYTGNSARAKFLSFPKPDQLMSGYTCNQQGRVIRA
ncbi:head-tail adaptor Ad1 [Stenotrophomonas phage Siara]|uniref:Putative DnaT-like domain-containing protein n=1 Tax=Stenotrophomonas phage Siara TaxID=2859658 RepID=A0AAE7WMG8_9CAUD|nr:head-tail adaptor Ad1 [Stenotrophomonas phage Siara]QYW02042.1 hypothetical protein CPT_Siara_039 [Stenotrophomonas phage Siara]